MQRKVNVLFLTQFSILLAILAIFSFSPLGSIPFTPTVVASLGAIPVIITAILLGTGAGTLMGLFAGIFSLIVWTFMPPTPPMAFLFTPFYSLGENSGNFGSLLISVVPRVLVGTVTGSCFRSLRKVLGEKKVLAYIAAGFMGSITNTVLVLGGFWLFFGTIIAADTPALMVLLGGIVLTNGIPEAVVSMIAAPAICRPLETILRRTAKR